MAIRFLSNQTINGTLDLTNRVKVSGNSTDQYFYEGERTGVGVTLRLYDNANTIYFDGYTGIVLRANQLGGSGGSIVFTGGNVGVGIVPAGSVAFDVKETDTANDLIVGLTAGTGARAQIRSVVQSANTESAISFHTTLSSSTQEKLRILATGALSVGNSGTNYGTSGQVLTSTGNAVPQWTTPTTGTITGSGTANKVTKFTGATAIGDGPITFSTNDATFAGLITATKTQDSQSLFTFINASTGTSATSRVVAEANAGSVQLIAAGSNFSGVSGAWQDAGVVCTSSMSGGLILASDNGVAINANGGTRALTISSSDQSATFTGQISGIGGNATTPSYIFEGNTDTGFFHPATDAIGFSTAGQEVMRIDANGNVAIQPGGATLTNTRLNVVSPDNYDPSLFDGMGGIRIGSGGSSSVGDGNYTGGIGFAIASGTSGIAGVQKGADGDKQGLAFFTHPSNTGGDAAEEKMRLDADGNLGIGTISPDQKLVVNQTATGRYAIKAEYNGTNLGGFFVDGSGNNELFMKASGNVEKVKIDTAGASHFSGGNVGIGTTSPAEKLEVSGSIKVGNMKLEPANGGRIGFNRNTSNGVIYDSNYAAFQINGAFSGNNFLEIQNYNSSGGFLGSVALIDGKFGIGTTAPASKLEIFGGGNTLRMDSAGNTAKTFLMRNVNTATAEIKTDGNLDINIEDANRTMRFLNGNSERMRIDSANNTNVSIKAVSGTAGNEAALSLLGTNLGGFGGSVIAQSRIDSLTDGTAYGSIMRLYTNNTSNTLTERMRINSSGRVGIGTTSPGRMLHVNGGSSNDGGIKLETTATATNFWSGIEMKTPNATSFIFTASGDSTGTIKFLPASSVKASLNATSFICAGDVVAYGSPSDITLKKNIKPLENSLDKIKNLQGVSFTWKKPGLSNIVDDIGFIAQDVKNVLPTLVRENEDGKLSMRHQGVIPILVEAIKELEARVKELEKKQ